MFGVGTKDARLHANQFINLLGEDNNGWGLSHKGLLWHDGICLHFTKRFVDNQATRIGLLFDGINGTLTYYKDGKCLGVAFRGLNEVSCPHLHPLGEYREMNWHRCVFQVKEQLYPIVTSTAAKTEMTLAETRRDFVNLQDRCRAVITKRIRTHEDLNKLQLPITIKQYLAEPLHDKRLLAPVDNIDHFIL